MKIIEIVLFCYLHIVLHEVCHFLFFVIQGVQVNKIYIMPIELVIWVRTKVIYSCDILQDDVIINSCQQYGNKIISKQKNMWNRDKITAYYE